MTTLYLAYGSNLNKRAMRMRCPTARPAGKKYLSNARLVFRGVADVELVKDPNSVVPCGLWVCNKADIEALDRYEGVHSGFYERWWIPVTYMGRKREALIYVMKDRHGIHPPSQFYVDTILKGYDDFNFTKKDRKIFEAAIDRSYDKEPSDQTTKRRERQKADPKQRRLVAMSPKVKKKKLADLAKRHIEKFIGDVAADYDGEPPPEAIREEAYTLGFDALINAGLTNEEAGRLAAQVARSFTSGEQ